VKTRPRQFSPEEIAELERIIALGDCVPHGSLAHFARKYRRHPITVTVKLQRMRGEKRFLEQFR
jgi:hypothetical protein